MSMAYPSNILATALAPAPVLAPKIEVQRLRTIRLYGKLGAQFGRVHHLAVANPAEAVQALIHLHPGFEKFLMEAKDNGMGFSVFVGTRNIGEKSLRHPCGNEDIRIAPVLLNSKNGWTQVLLGIVLIAATIVLDIWTSGRWVDFPRQLTAQATSTAFQ
ncbi:hypothetical protein [Solilutibacter silvestris]|uniref:Bacteriophage lambda tail assembly protein I n=1 Tax=Solilutibacter silvestris TaxID=1645665 RepID=A0A2K1PYG8_9GAMM|nr:hypothetical protein [Lysobacter silvestris]PNS07830.1 Bacteriophage lambda tail assembly protein I [Lysobacter silvestris]